VEATEHEVTQRLGNARHDFTRPEEIPRQEQPHQQSRAQAAHSHCAANSASKRQLPYNFFTSTHSVNTLQSGTHQPPVRSRFRTPRPRNQRPRSSSHFRASADCTDVGHDGGATTQENHQGDGAASIRASTRHLGAPSRRQCAILRCHGPRSGWQLL
jgi:hypothetical protein